MSTFDDEMAVAAIALADVFQKRGQRQTDIAMQRLWPLHWSDPRLIPERQQRYIWRLRRLSAIERVRQQIHLVP